MPFFIPENAPHGANRSAAQRKKEGRMPKPDQAPAAEDAAAEPAQGQAADTAAGEEKDYKALYEEALAQSRKWEKRSKDNRAELEGLKQSAPKPDPTGIIPAYAGNTKRRPFLADALRRLAGSAVNLERMPHAVLVVVVVKLATGCVAVPPLVYKVGHNAIAQFIP